MSNLDSNSPLTNPIIDVGDALIALLDALQDGGDRAEAVAHADALAGTARALAEALQGLDAEDLKARDGDARPYLLAAGAVLKRRLRDAG